ncbi:two-component system [Oryzomicrobium terrae]|uniref:Two-component system n=1 Tax=Oryzomicrobium terrae TaxID=1735038 RepID=A0A5C1EBV0_9RHOO|nr:cache domain-containing protein [Oryzomicrobium terrae]QEL66069.1 two-component system [Oryzomicrobium terrae]
MDKIRATTQPDYVVSRSEASVRPSAEGRLRRKILLLAVVPLVIACISIALAIRQQGEALAREEAAAVAPVLNAMKEAELKHYMELARAAIAPIYDSGRNDAAAQQQVKDVLSRLAFGVDGYFFVYDQNGNNLMHPRQPELVGRNLWELRDPNGTPTIQRLLARAKGGGGYEPYLWERPTTRRMEQKLGYVIPLERWGWMIGTGIYLDDVDEALKRIHRESVRQIDTNLQVVAAIAVVAALLVGVAGLALNISEHRLADVKLRTLARQVVSSQEEERARLSRELHDGVSQMLVSVKFFLESARSRLAQGPERAAEATPLLERGITRLNEILGEVRRISHALRPALLDDLGLAAALDHLGRDFADRTGLTVSVSHRGSGGELPEAVVTALFRVAQEALSNVERHAGATSVSIETTQDALGLRLSIRDDGQGFDVAGVEQHPRSGIGLRNMRERLAALRGTLSIESGASGTELSVFVPAGAHPFFG